MKTKEEVHSELCMLYSRRDVHSHTWARGELASQSLLDDIWGKIYALRWVLDKNIQWGVADQPDEKGEAGPFEKWPLMSYCYPGCEMPKAPPTPLGDAALEELERQHAEWMAGGGAMSVDIAVHAYEDKMPGLLTRLRASESLFSLLVEHRQAASDNYDWAIQEHGEKSAEATAAYQGWNELDTLYLKLIEKGAERQ